MGARNPPGGNAQAPAEPGLLGEALADGRLTAEEDSERIELLYASRAGPRRLSSPLLPVEVHM
jgi:hypothetical protein